MLTLALATALSLAACGGPPDDMPQTGAELQERMTHRIVRAEYACLNGERLSVTFDNPREMATVRMIDGTAVDLRQERAADGIWYRADRYDLRGSGVDATWRSPNRDETTCRAIG